MEGERLGPGRVTKSDQVGEAREQDLQPRGPYTPQLG